MPGNKMPGNKMPDIKVVGVMSKPGIPHASTILSDLVRWWKEHGVETRLDQESARYLGSDAGLAREQVPEGAQLVMVLGGDGTLLAAARAVAGREIPLFPVNLGGLGFLTAITLEQLYPELENALNGRQHVVPRRMLHGEVQRGGQAVASYEALNDIVISKTQIARMIDLETFVDGQYVSTFKADGLIIATPTGSTAYSLSAGGPIVYPAVEALCITPVCPHMLTNRPVLVPNTSVIEIVCKASHKEVYLTIDGQVGEPLAENDRVVCRSSRHQVHLIRPPNMFFFDVLRQKLKWGER
jgi:NAD+ kinase